ncbi:hypothetical protein M8J75_010038 [Diaphorina citri]|nr:hypothetical protein M8J75_010038 [Diaphorina citri]
MDIERELEDGNDTKANEYVKTLLKEKMTLDSDSHSYTLKLLDDEINKAMASNKKKYDSPYLDLFREKPILVKVKVLVPVKEHPRFNFVGKLLGPKGNSLRRLQEETMTKMSILGKGSMRDRSKEEELRKEGDPKNAHLVEDLHVQVSALAPPAEAHARIAYALSELRKYIIPDVNDEIRQEQFREMGYVHHEPRPQMRHPRPPPHMVAARPAPGLLAPPRMQHAVPPHMVRPPHPPPPPAASRGKVLSILDRARAAMEKPAPSAGVYEYEDPHAAHAYYETTASYDPAMYDPYASTAGDYYDTSASYYETAAPAPLPSTSSRTGGSGWKSSSGYAEHHSSSRSKSSAPIRSSSSEYGYEDRKRRLDPYSDVESKKFVGSRVVKYK